MILGLTMARGGSKGVPGKHLRRLGGLPLIAYTLKVALGSKRLDEYAVSSDDEEILRVAEEYGAANLILRPAFLAQDDTPMMPALKHALDWMETRQGRFSHVAVLMATSPLKRAEDVDGAIDLLLASGAESVIGVTELSGDRHPARAKRLVNGVIRDFCVPEPKSGLRQDLVPKAYVRNGTIYAFRRDVLDGPGALWFGHKHSLAYVMPGERSVNIDEMQDFALAEMALDVTRPRRM